MLLGIDASRAIRPAGQRTGTEFYARQLIQHCARLAAENWPNLRMRLYAQAPADPQLFRLTAQSEWRVIPFPRLWTHIRLSVEMAARPPDALFVPAHVLPLWRPRRSFVTIHDVGYLHFPAAHPPRQRAYLDWSTRWSTRVATHIFADSQATARDLASHLGVPSQKITVVYPGFNPDLQRVSDLDACEKVAARHKIHAPYVLFVGTLQPRKNLVRLATAFRDVLTRWRDEFPDKPAPQLVFAGKTGWLAETLLAELRAVGLGNSLKLLGYVPETDMPALLSGASVLAFPSLYEGFGFPILEAQACRVPVLTSTTSSCPEVAGEGALLVDPLDTAAIAPGLWQLLTEPELRAKLIDCGERNLARFSWEQAAQRVLSTVMAHA